MNRQEFCEDVLKAGFELSLAMIDAGAPYVLPLNYGYRNGRLYIHSRRSGKKLDCLRRNPRICFTVNEVVERVGGERPCQWTTRFRSVVGSGTACIIEDPREKIAGYDAIMAQFGGPEGGYDADALDASVIICIEIEQLTGKWSDGCRQMPPPANQMTDKEC